MPYFKDQSNKVHFLSDADVQAGFEKLLPTGCQPITDQAAAQALAPTADQLWLAHRVMAQAALDASDMTALRCYKAGVPFPSEWLAYVSSLRVIVNSSSGDPTQPLPTRPAYPSNT